MFLKPGVRIHGIAPEMVVALMAADGVYRANGAELVVTSVADGVHSRGSKHYIGHAVDLRTRHIKPQVAVKVRNELAEALGADFDVVLEGDHIHVEFDPKEAY